MLKILPEQFMPHFASSREVSAPLSHPHLWDSELLACNVHRRYSS